MSLQLFWFDKCLFQPSIYPVKTESEKSESENSEVNDFDSNTVFEVISIKEKQSLLNKFCDIVSEKVRFNSKF